MTNMFPHIPDFAWISHALPLNEQIIALEKVNYTKRLPRSQPIAGHGPV